MHKETELTTQDDESLEVPEALVARLKAADRAPPLITAQVDRRVLADAKAQFARRRPVWRQRAPRPVWAALAASLVLGLFIVWDRPQPPSGPAVPVYADVDGSGHIDIADVLALARASGTDAASQAELDAFARQVVALGRDAT